MKKWSNLEDEYLRLNMQNKSLSRLAQDVNRSRTDLLRRMRQLQIDPQQRVWDQEEIVDEIKKLHNRGEQLNIQHVIRNYKELVTAAYRKDNFNCWEEAIAASGLDYSKIRRVRRWDKELIIKEIKSLVSEQVSINSKNVQDHYPQLRSAAFRHFGSWREAVKAAGYDYEEVKITVSTRRKSRKWSSGNVLEALHAVVAADGVRALASNNIWKHHKSLYNAACYYYKSWAEAVSAAGYDYTKVRLMKKWTKEQILDTIRELHDQGVPLNITSITTERYDLYKAGRNQFGSWKKAITEAGLSYGKIRLNKKRRKRKVTVEE